MIVPHEHGMVFVDVGRPNLFTDRDFEFWNAFHDWIRETPIPIAINNIFPFIQEMLNTHTRYGGGGMKYYFWMHKENVQLFKDSWRIK